MLAGQVIGISLNIVLIASFSNRCNIDNNMLICCFGYRWNSSSSSCIECPQGFTGANCTIQCPFPTYGRKCQEKCTCKRSSCDSRYGCILSMKKFSTSRLPDLGFSTILNTQDENVTEEIEGGTRKQKIERKSNVLSFLVIGLVSLFVPLLMFYAIIKFTRLHKRFLKCIYQNEAEDEDITYSEPIDMKL
ncbi:uncharacterized protein LOC134273026 [Saccostrea cucullata]|uniref:uncharacterized protein LOC134273026 n=1 Tax=Saccostrea cuccullata TaxID=36930 RepID=UPI002ED0CC72